MKKLISLTLSILLISSQLLAQASSGTYTIDRFDGGLNSHTNPYKLPENQALVAKNVRINETYASLANRNPLLSIRDFGTGAITGLYRYYTAAGNSYTIASIGTTVAADISSTATTISTGLTDSKRWQFVTYKDLLIGGNGYDRNIKWDGKTVTTADTDSARTAGDLCAQLGAPFAERNTGANLTASKWYCYKMQFTVSAVGYYSTAISNPLQTGATVKDITLTGIPIGPTGTTARAIYRTAGNASRAAAIADTSYYLVTTISDNSTLTYNDTMTDATLTGQTAWSITGKSDITPPMSKYLEINNNTLFEAGVVAYPSYLYFSDKYNPDYFPTTYFERIRQDDGDVTTFIKTFLGILTVGKTNTIQKYYTEKASVTDWYPSDPFSFIGCPAPYSAAVSPIGIIYAGRDGIYKFDGQNSILISDAATQEIRDIKTSDIANTVGYYIDSEYHYAYTSNTSTEAYNNRELILNFIRNAYVLDYKNINCYAALIGSSDSGELYSGSSTTDGYVFSNKAGSTVLSKKSQADFDAGTYDDTRVYLDSNGNPILELSWDCTIDGWLTELQTKDADITTIDSITTELSGVPTIDRPDTGGTWTSPAYTVTALNLDKLYWNEDLNTYGDITFQIRTDSVSPLTTAYTATPYTNPNGSDLSGETGNTYAQIKITLSTTDIAYSPFIEVLDNYSFKFSYAQTGSNYESTIPVEYRTGYTDFGVETNKKLVRRIRVFYEGLGGRFTVNFRNSEGSIDRSFTVNMETSPSLSTTDDYEGNDTSKVYTYRTPVNSESEPSPIGQFWQFKITSTTTDLWKISKIEILYEVQELYD